MFLKKQRLTKKEFDAVFKKGRRVHTPTLQMIYTKSGTFRCAVVVGKKVHKKAIHRNKLRRRIYGVMRVYQKEHSLQEGKYILIAKPALKEVPREALVQEVASLLHGV